MRKASDLYTESGEDVSDRSEAAGSGTHCLTAGRGSGTDHHDDVEED